MTRRKERSARGKAIPPAPKNSRQRPVDSPDSASDAAERKPPGGDPGGGAPDLAETVAFVRWHSRGGPALLVAISPDGGPITAEQFKPEEDEKAITAWLKKNARHNLYYHVNLVPQPRRNKGGGAIKAEKEDVTAVHYLHTDIDPPLEGGTEEWKAATLELLRAHDPPPTTIVFSGNGFNALWALKEPIALDGTEAAADAVALYNWKLALDLRGDIPTRDISRVLRLPGTTNWPTKKKREKGRVVGRAEWIPENLDRTYSLDQFRKHDGSTKAKEAEPPEVDLSELKKGDGFATLDEIVELRDKFGEGVKAIIAREPEPSEDRSRTVYQVINAMIRAKCSDKTIGRVLLDPQWPISRHVLEQNAPRKYAERQIARARAEAEGWVQNEKGIVANHQGNIRTALERLGVRLSRDKFANRTLIVREGDAEPCALKDEDGARLRLKIEREFRFRPEKEYFFDVLLDLAHENEFHPVCDYLGSSKWDGTPRIDDWLIRYGKAADTPYIRAVGRLVLVAAVRRVRKPGCEFHEMVVLESPQGQLKSTALQVLAVQKEWFSDDLPLSADSKLVIERTAGKWIIEGSELKGMRKGDVEHVKALLSRNSDFARLAYGRLPLEVPRQFVVIGSTNATDYLRDVTGNRRFWPVRVGQFDIAGLKRVRDQLWAEAADAEAKGEPIRMDETLYGAAAIEQDLRTTIDAFEEILAPLLDGKVGKISSENIWSWLDITKVNRTQVAKERLGGVMRRLGWEYAQRSYDGVKLWGYAKGSREEREKLLTLPKKKEPDTI